MKNIESKKLSLLQAVKLIQSHDRIWAGAYLSAPKLFLRELSNHASGLNGVALYSGMLTENYEFLRPEYKGKLDYKSLFMGPLEKSVQGKGNVEIIPYHLSDIDKILNEANCNVVVIEVSDIDENGYFSLGACGGIGNIEALNNASIVIGVVNRFQPYICNKENLIHYSHFDFIVEGHHELSEIPEHSPNNIELKIAENIDEYIKDNSTLQLGIGGASNAIGMVLCGKKQGLKVHTEMLTESMMHLWNSGSIDRNTKMVAAFTAGTKDLYEFVNENPNVELRNIVDVNNPETISKHDDFISINNCLMVDLTGQVASEGIGHKQISGTGGQVDFVRGANMSKGGVSILALPSTLIDPLSGEESSKIQLTLPAGTPVTTARTDVHLIATEYGAVNLVGLSTKQRAKRLIELAAPKFRDSLTEQAKSVGLI